MTNRTSDSRRPPFVIQKDFILTAFAKRFQGFVQSSWQQRTWHVITALPGSGKSWSIRDLVLHSGARKEATGETYLPVLAICTPMLETEQALVTAIATVFGAPVTMPWYIRRNWVVKRMADVHVECLIFDDAHFLSLSHLSYIKELTDKLALPPFQREVGLCLATAHTGDVIPLKKDYFDRPETLWRQFRWRMDTEHPFRVVPGHTREEVQRILATYEGLYRSQLPDLNLQRWTKSIYTWLTHQTLDPDATKRVTMIYLARFVTGSLRRAYEQGMTDVDKEILETMASIMLYRRDEFDKSDDVTPDEPPTP
jgi:AAA domain